MTLDELYSLITSDDGGSTCIWRLTSNIDARKKIENEIFFSEQHSPSFKILATAYIQTFHSDAKFKSKYNLYLWNEALYMRSISISDVAEAYRLALAQLQKHKTHCSYSRISESEWWRDMQQRKAKQLAEAAAALLAYLKAYSNFQQDNPSLSLNLKTIGVYEEQNPSKVFCRKLEAVLQLSPGKCCLDGRLICLSLANYRACASALIELGLDVKYEFAQAFSFWGEAITLQSNLADAIAILTQRQAEMLSKKAEISLVAGREAYCK